MDKKEKSEVGKCQSLLTNETDSVASMETAIPPVDWVNYSVLKCFQEEDYIHDTQAMRLHMAARDNNTNSIKKSIERGLSVCLPDAVGRSALHWAAVFCKPETVETIIQLFPVSRLDLGDRNGCSPLHYAVLAGRADVTNMLLKAGCHVHSIDKQGRTPLHYAAQNANAFLVSLLLKRGADPSHRDKMKRSPYDVAKEYNNTDKILQCLQLETCNTPVPEKPRPVQPRPRKSTMKTKAVETDGKLSITFLTNMEAAQAQQSWQPYVPKTEKELLRDNPVEAVKEEMERDAERMKYKLRKIETRKKRPSEEKLREQERALQQLLVRSKKNAKEKRRKRLAEEERQRWLTQNRTRSATPKTCSIPQSSLGMRTPPESIIGHFQTSRRPSNASSPQCETEKMTSDSQEEWREETWTARDLHTPNIELPTQKGTVEKATERQPTEHSPQKANATGDDTVQQKQAEQENEQEHASATPTPIQTYVHQWFANTFSHPVVPDINASLRERFAPTNIEDIDFGTPPGQSFPSPQEENLQMNLFTESSSPPTLVNKGLSTTPPDIPGEHNNKSRIDPLSSPSDLSTSSYKSPASPQSKTSIPPSPPSMSGGTKNSTAQSSPPATKMGQAVRHNDVSALVDDQKETEVRPGCWDEHTPVEHKDRESHPKRTTEDPNISASVTSLSGRGHSSPQDKFSRHIASTDSHEDNDDDIPLGYAHSFKSRKYKPRVDTPPNRHGLECFARPKAQKTKVQANEYHKWQSNHVSPKHSWSPDEPWRPGGISKTVVDFKTSGLLRAQSKNSSVRSTRFLYRMTQSKQCDDEEDIDSDPFANVEPQENEEIDPLSLAKVIRQQEALWSLREASQPSPGDSDHDRQGSQNSELRSTQKKLEGNPVCSPRTNNPSSECMLQSFQPTEVVLETRENTGMTRRTEEEQGMCTMEMISEQPTRLCCDEPSRHYQLDTVAQTHPPQLTKTLRTHRQRSLQPLEMGLQYASFIQQEGQRVDPKPSSSFHPQTECPLALESSPQKQVSRYSTTFQSPQADIVYPRDSYLQLHTMPPYHLSQKTRKIPCLQIPSNRTNPQMLVTWPQQNTEDISLHESHPESYRQDELEIRVSKTYGVPYETRSTQHRDREARSGSQSTDKRLSSRCSLGKVPPARLALMEYYGQSVRPQFLGLGRKQPRVHQCIDVKSLIKQWL